MTSMRFCSRLTVALGLSLVALPALASQGAVLGDNADLYVVKAGVYGSLFPNGKETNPSNAVLALELTRPGEPTQRLLVPGTRELDVENSPALIFEDDSNVLFVAWESKVNNFHSILRLVSFDGTRWSDPVDVAGNSFAPKTPPQIAVTRDAYQATDGEGQTVVRHRTILHLSWVEENEGGLLATLYKPVIIEDGTYLKSAPVYRLNNFAKGEDLTASVDAASLAALVRTPMIQAGVDGRTVVIVFTSAATGRLASVEVDVLPTELSQLAEKARAYIIELGVSHKPAELPAIAMKVREYINSIGGAFQSEVIHSIADLVHAYLLTRPPGGSDDLTPLADDARAYIIELGSKFSGRGLRTMTAALSAGGSSSPAIIEIPRPAQEEGTQSPHLIRFRVASNRVAPSVGNGTIRLFASETGENLIATWTGKDRVFYRDSQANGWSVVREIRLTDSFSLEKAYEVLAQRVRNR